MSNQNFVDMVRSQYKMLHCGELAPRFDPVHPSESLLLSGTGLRSGRRFL